MCYDAINKIGYEFDILREQESIVIRTANINDLMVISSIYETARRFMDSQGNPGQWGRHYPSKEQIAEDIEKEQLYVYETEGNVHGVFVFAIGEDPTYQHIENGSWISDSTYGFIHRVAGDGTQKGLMKNIIEYCSEIIFHLRIDTHEDNKIMQHLILKNGFKQCGTIFTADGSPRIAFERMTEGIIHGK